MDKLFSLFKQIESTPAAPTGAVSFLIVGLGNYGDNYKNTRHNAGFLALGDLAESMNVTINKGKFHSLVAEATLADRRVLLMLPQTLMNNSGIAVKEALDFYKLTPDDFVVLHDDISLPCGRIRIRPSGSAGGHNGLKSIIEHVGSDKFKRIKIGVGEKPHPEMDLAEWVLSAFSDDEKKAMASRYPDIREAVKLILSGNIEDAMNRCNGSAPAAQ